MIDRHVHRAFINEREKRYRKSFFYTRIMLWFSMATVVVSTYMLQAPHQRVFPWAFMLGFHLCNVFVTLWWGDRLRNKIAQANVQSLPSAHVIRVLQGGKAACREPSNYRSSSIKL